MHVPSGEPGGGQRISGSQSVQTSQAASDTRVKPKLQRVASAVNKLRGGLRIRTPQPKRSVSDTALDKRRGQSASSDDFAHQRGLSGHSYESITAQLDEKPAAPQNTGRQSPVLGQARQRAAGSWVRAKIPNQTATERVAAGLKIDVATSHKLSSDDLVQAARSIEAQAITHDPEGQVIVQEHRVEGFSDAQGSEEVIRDSGTQRLQDVLIAKIDDLAARLEHVGEFGNESKQLKAQLARALNQLSNLNADTYAALRGYLDSMYNRANLGDKVAQRLDAQGDISGAEYAEMASELASGLVHARIDTLTTRDGEQVSVTRLGVMSHHADGQNNLADLSADLEQIGGLEDADAAAMYLEVRRNEFDGTLQELSKDLKSARKAASKAREELPELKAKQEQEPSKPLAKKIKKAEKAIEEERAIKANIASTYASRNVFSSVESLQEAVDARRDCLQTQMLQYLGLQADANSTRLSGIQEGGSWDVVDLRLLNPQKDEFDHEQGSGWCHNESNELTDMHQIFKEFDGATITFGDRGPCIVEDPEGGPPQIFLPKAMAGGQEKTITLNATLLNVSIQGQFSNSGMQAEINEEAMAKLEKQHPQLLDNDNWKAAKKRMGKGKSDGTVAENVLAALVESGLSTSVGCLSAKDRTGWVVGRMMTKMMAKEEQNSSVQRDIEKSLTMQLLDKETSVALKVIDDVTPGATAMKLDPRTMGKAAGVAGMVKHGMDLVGMYTQNQPLSDLEIEPVESTVSIAGLGVDLGASFGGVGPLIGAGRARMISVK